MKSVHLTSSWHEKSGGIATFYRELIAAANREQHHIRLIVPGPSDLIEDVGNFGRIYHVAAPVAPVNSDYRILYPTQFLASNSTIQRILRHERPDLVEICDKYNLNYLGALLRLGLLAGVDCKPAVAGLSCERMDDNFAVYLSRGRLGRSFSRFYMRWLYFPFFDYHIANSAHTAAELAPAAQGHAVPRRVWVRPMGVDTSRFSPMRRSEPGRQRLLRSCGADRECALLLYAGRLAPEKNLDLLISVMEQLSIVGPQFRLLIVGEGIEEQRLKALAGSRVPGKVTFLGHVADRDVLAELYANCDVFLHPNPREPFGIAPLEAMAAGIALVAPNIGGVTSYANLENAWTVEPTVAAFAQAVWEAVTSPPIRERKIQAALQAAARLAWRNVASDYLKLYQEMVRLHRGLPSTTGLEPAFTSTGATKSRMRIIQGAAGLAKAGFNLWTSWTESHGSTLGIGESNPGGNR